MDLLKTDDSFNSDLENDSKDEVKLLPELWEMIFHKIDSTRIDSTKIDSTKNNSTTSLRQNLGLVCKEWRKIIQYDPSFSSELKLKKGYPTGNNDSFMPGYVKHLLVGFPTKSGLCSQFCKPKFNKYF